MTTGRFRFVEDSLYASYHRFQIWKNFPMGRDSNIAKEYANGNLYVVFPLKSALCNCIGNLIVRSVRDISLIDDYGRSHDVGAFHVRHIDPTYRANGGNESVFRGVTQLVDGIEQVTPSLVRLEVGK